MKVTGLVFAFPIMLALGVVLHRVLAAGAKAVLSSWQPLASGGAEAASYDRRVYHTADPMVAQVIGVALLAGLLFWGAMALPRGGGWLVFAGIVVVLGAVALDLWRWQRVAASASSLWFQRGFGQPVHQLVFENILDVAVEEADGQGPTLMGLNTAVARLCVTTTDQRVVQLPKTDARRGSEGVEAVANHVRQRLDQMGQRRAIDQSSAQASQAAAAAAAQAPKPDDEMRAALRKLRAKATQPNLPPSAKRN